jgi:hypothetical protein
MQRISRTLSLGILFGWICAVLPVEAEEHGVAPLNEPAPKDALSPEIAGELADTGFRVTRGSATYCDLWLCKSLPVASGFKPSSDVLYPFTPGGLIGVVRISQRGSDFREQDIATGVYTLRYAQQPVDGAHVGTSPTRDFLLLSKAATDRSLAVVEEKNLSKQSADAAGSAHPALLCLQPVPAGTAQFPSIRHDEQRDWWIVALRGEAKLAGPLPIGIVVAGVAPEQ